MFLERAFEHSYWCWLSQTFRKWGCLRVDRRTKTPSTLHWPANMIRRKKETQKQHRIRSFEHGENFKGSVHFRQKIAPSSLNWKFTRILCLVCVKKAGFASAFGSGRLSGDVCAVRVTMSSNWQWKTWWRRQVATVLSGWFMVSADRAEALHNVTMWQRSRSKPMRRRCPRDSHCVSCDFSTLMRTTTLSFRPTSHSRSWPRIVQSSSELSVAIAKQRNKSAALCDVGTAFACMQVYHRRNNGSNAEKRRSVDQIFLPFWTDRQTDTFLITSPRWHSIIHAAQKKEWTH